MGKSTYKGVNLVCSKCMMVIKTGEPMKQRKGADPNWLYYDHTNCKRK